jgi:hypothetical protein
MGVNRAGQCSSPTAFVLPDHRTEDFTLHGRQSPERGPEFRRCTATVTSLEQSTFWTPRELSGGSASWPPLLSTTTRRRKVPVRQGSLTIGNTTFQRSKYLELFPSGATY